MAFRILSNLSPAVEAAPRPPPAFLRAAPPRPWHRRRLVTLSLAVATALMACAARDDALLRPGVSDALPQAPDRARLAPASSNETWALPSSSAGFVLVDDRQLPSRGHNPPYWSGTVRVSAALDPLYHQLGPSSVIPAGAIAVEQHVDASGAPQATFAMVKRDPGFDPAGADWEYLVTSPDGKIQNRGVLPLCARCHADATGDHLFGPRLSSRRHVGATPPPGGESAVGPDEDEARSPEDDQPAAGSRNTPSRPRSRKKRPRTP